MKIETQQRIARNLKIIRVSNGLNQTQMAEYSGVSRAVYLSYENGELYDDGLMEARAVTQTDVFDAAVKFARIEGILPAPESSHAIRVAVDEALECKRTGQQKNIVFGLTGTGYFDLYAYARYNDGQMTDRIPTDEELAEARKALPAF